MTTQAQLQAAFTWEFSETPENITYRKYTSDIIPEYTLTLKNASSEFYINVFAAQLPYTTITRLSDNTLLTRSASIQLPPEGQEDVLVTFSTDEINASVDTISRISFILEALAPETSASPTPTSEPTLAPTRPRTAPTVPASSTPPGGGRIGPVGPEVDVPGPIAEI